MPEPEQQQAQQLRDRFHEEAARVAEDPDLAVEGVERRVRELHQALEARLHELREEEATRREETIEGLRRKAWGVTFDRDAVGTEAGRETVRRSYRAALAQARTLESNEQARNAMVEAFDTGDRQLGKAILKVAWERGYRDALALYERSHPDQLETLRELQRLETRAQDKTARFARNAAFHVPQLPNVSDLIDAARRRQHMRGPLSGRQEGLIR